MKTTRVSARAKSVNDLLARARRQALILESANGDRFVLASIEGWQAYTLDKGEDVTKNKRLMKHLKDRRSANEAISLADLKTELGLD